MEIPSFVGEVDVENLNNWLRKLEVYFQVQGVEEDSTRIPFIRLNLSGNVLIWWETHFDSLKHETLQHVSSCKDFK